MTIDDSRFRRLYAEHATAVHRFALRRAGPDVADDVLAETFLVAWRRLDDVPADRERAWLLTTARWVLSGLARSGRRRDSLLIRLPVPPHEPDPAPAVADALDVRRALARLSPVDQELLRLIEWDQLTHAEAAAVLGCGVAALSVRLRRARARFGRALLADNASDRPPPAEPFSPSPTTDSLKEAHS